ncbi:MAG: tetratricopeptide repeat protein [Chitinophagaceae bacterium]
MKNIFVFCFLLVSSVVISQPTSDLYKTARSLMNEGDYENATLVFNKLLNNEPNNIVAQKDFAYLCFLKRDFAKSIELSKKLIADSSVDEQDYQLLGMNYKAIALYKDCDKLYKIGLAKYPNSGVLYNELADLNMIEKRNNDAIKNWEKGIEVDPNYPANYYNAAMYYSKNNQLFWAIIYGEIFVNLESYTTKTAEIKELIVDAYKKVLYLGDAGKNTKNQFEKTVLQTLGNSSESLTAAYLTAIRTKFILTWFYEKKNENFPFRLFDQQRFLVREGLFDAYNQWLFGVAINPVQYKSWADTHASEVTLFKQFQEGRVFKLITGQYYKN